MSIPAALLLAVSCAANARAGPASTRTLLQAHRQADHWNPMRNLAEARRALDRAWKAADPDERQKLDRLRTDFAALVLSFSHVPTATDRAPQAVAGTSGNDTPKPVAPAEPTESGAIVPPKTSGAVPPPATSDKRPAEWQLKYAEVDRDLKAMPPAANRVLANRLDRFRTHLQMFYAAALGR